MTRGESNINLTPQLRLIKIHLFNCTSWSSYDNNRFNVEIQEMLNATNFERTVLYRYNQITDRKKTS